jgi:hypothetical protein
VNWFIGADTVQCLGTSLQLHVWCIQSTLHVSVRSYISWRGFLFLGACRQFQHTVISSIMLVIRVYGYSCSFTFEDF